MTTYDAQGRPVQSVDPGLAAVGIIGAGLVGAAIANNNNDDHYRHQKQQKPQHRENHQGGHQRQTYYAPPQQRGQYVRYDDHRGYDRNHR